MRRRTNIRRMFESNENRNSFLFVKTRDMRVGFYTPTQRPWGASFGYRKAVSTEPLFVYRGLLKPPIEIMRSYASNYFLSQLIMPRSFLPVSSSWVSASSARFARKCARPPARFS